MLWRQLVLVFLHNTISYSIDGYEVKLLLLMNLITAVANQVQDKEICRSFSQAEKGLTASNYGCKLKPTAVGGHQSISPWLHRTSLYTLLQGRPTIALFLFNF